jgi:hypothetical protein
MNRWHKRLLGALTVVAGASGLAYLWMKYFIESQDPFAVINHPWQPYVLYVHLLSSPALVLVFGMVWTSHVSGKLDDRRPYSRRSGLVSIWTFAVMAASGYLLQVVTSERVHTAMVIVHVASGVAFLLAYAGHLALSLRAARARRRERLRSAA